jgi:hypothetical protein
MRVRMTTSRIAALDGVTVRPLLGGVEYELPHGLAKRYISRGLAEPISPPENRALPAPPEVGGLPKRPLGATKPRRRKRG